MGGKMNNRNLLKAAALAFITVLLLNVMFCKPTSTVPAKLILHIPCQIEARANAMLYVSGEVTNVGGAIAYDGKLTVVVNEGEREYRYLLGDFNPGECKHFECDLDDYGLGDEVGCTFRLSWEQERLLACVSMESGRVSYGD